MKMKKKIAVTALAVSLALGTFPGIPLNMLGNNGVVQAGVMSETALNPSLLARIQAVHDQLNEAEKTAIRNAREKLWVLNSSVIESTQLWADVQTAAAATNQSITSTEFMDVVKFVGGSYYDVDGKYLKGNLESFKTTLKKLAVIGGNHSLNEETAYTEAEAFAAAVETALNNQLTPENFTNVLTTTGQKTILTSAAQEVLGNTSLTFSGILNTIGITASELVDVQSVISPLIDTTDDQAQKALIMGYLRTKTALSSTSISSSSGSGSLALTVFGNAIPSTYASLITWSVMTPPANISLSGSTITNTSDGNTTTVTVQATVPSLTLLGIINPLLFTGQVTVTNNAEPTPPPADDTGSTPEPEPIVKPSIPTFTKVITTPKVDISIEKDENGVEVAVAKVDKEDLKKKLDENKEAKALVIDTGAKSGKAKAKLQVSDVKDAAVNNGDNVFIVKSSGTEYAIPAGLLNTQTAGLGISDSDAANAEVSVNIEERSDSTVKKGRSKLASKVVDFSITVASGGNTVELNDFGNTYVDRAFDLTQNVSPAKAVGVVVNSDGTISPVPTEFVEVDGRSIAVLKRNSNSTYTVVENEVSFTDINNHWAEDNILLLGNKLIVNGYGDGSFMPAGNITRGEFATMIARNLGFDTTNTEVSAFTDIQSDEFYAGALNALVKHELINGYTDGTFKPNAQITRQDAAVMIANAIEFLKIKGDQQAKTFKDSSIISDYAASSIDAATKLGIINGYKDNTFKPKAQLNRAESVIMLQKLLEAANFITK